LQQQPSALESLCLAQQQSIAATLQQQQDLLAQQQATLDRIVTARYDRPIALPAQQLPADAMSDWALNDQSDVRPAEIDAEIKAGIEALTVESDAEFLAAVGATK
jgi:hypothetical protein